MPKKESPKKNKIDQLDERSKKAIMWILVGIFTVFFIFIGFFSFKSNLSSTDNENIFSDIFSEFSEVKDKITDSINKAKATIWSGDEVVVDEKKIDE